MKLDRSFFFILLALFFSSCEEKSKSEDGKKPQTVSPTNRPVIEEEIDIKLLTTLRPINTNLESLKIGGATIERTGDTFEAMVLLTKSTPTTWHKQAIYSGDRCPELKDDLNKDAYIDIDEAEKVLGKVLIPLDSDLDSQLGGWNLYPISSAEGGFEWSKTASFSRLLEDIKSTDEKPKDNILKLAKKDKLILTGRVILIQGTSDTTVLPTTVAHQGANSAQVSLPVACGVLVEQ